MCGAQHYYFGILTPTPSLTGSKGLGTIHFRESGAEVFIYVRLSLTQHTAVNQHMASVPTIHTNLMPFSSYLSTYHIVTAYGLHLEAEQQNQNRFFFLPVSQEDFFFLPVQWPQHRFFSPYQTKTFHLSHLNKKPFTLPLWQIQITTIIILCTLEPSWSKIWIIRAWALITRQLIWKLRRTQ